MGFLEDIQKYLNDKASGAAEIPTIERYQSMLQPKVPPTVQDTAWEDAGFPLPAEPTPRVIATDTKPQPQIEPELPTQDAAGPVPLVQKTTKPIPAPEPPMSPRQMQARQALSMFSGELGDESLKKAQEKADRSNLIANLLRSGDKIAEGFSRGAFKADDKVASAIEAQGGKGVKDIQERRAGKMQEMSASAQQLDLQKKQDKNDPNSDISKNMRKMYGESFKQLTKLPGFELMTADDLEQSRNILEFRDRLDARKEERSYRDKLLALEKEKKSEDKADKAMRLAAEFWNKGAAEKMVKEVEDKQNLFHTWEHVLSKNGIIDAKEDGPLIMQVGKALQGDNSVLREGDVKTLFGGSMSLAEAKANWAKGIFTATPKLTPAMRKLLVQRVKDVSDNAIKSAHNRYGNVHELNTKYISPEDAVRALPPVLRSGPFLPKGEGPSQSTTSTVKEASSKDQEAIAWAKANKSDPRAKKILKFHGLE